MRFISSLLCIAWASAATADVITLDNGDRISGQIKGLEDNYLLITSPYSDQLRVRVEHVTAVESGDMAIQVLLDGKVAVQAPTEDAAAVTAASAPVIAPAEIAAATEASEPRAWKGKIDLNSSVSRGNTESHLVNLQGNLQLTRGDHRYLSDITTIREEVDGVTQKEQDRLKLGYNYLFKDGVLEHWFFAMNATLERDPVALLDRRFSLNPSLGYDFWDEPNRQLSVQLGAGYADEEINNQDESSSLIDWRLDFSYDLMAGNIELFHNHHIYRNLNGRENTVFNSKTGVRYDITDGIYLNVQVNYDYDTEPAAGTDSKDVTFLVGAGVDL